MNFLCLNLQQISNRVKSCMRMGSGEEKEGLQEKSDPPPDQIVAVIGKEMLTSSAL